MSELDEDPPPLDEGHSPVELQIDQFARSLAEIATKARAASEAEEVTLEGKTLIEVLGERPKFQLTPEKMKAREEKLRGKMMRVEIDEDDFQDWLKARAQGVGA